MFCLSASDNTIEIEVTIFKDFTISFEMQVYFLKTISNDQSSQLEISDRYMNDINFEHIELKTLVNNNFKFSTLNLAIDWINSSYIPVIRAMVPPETPGTRSAIPMAIPFKVNSPR